MFLSLDVKTLFDILKRFFYRNLRAFEYNFL